MFHVDYVKAIHKGGNVVYNFEKWVLFVYVYPNIVRFKSVRGKFHEYSPITLYYTTRGEVNIDMRNYVKNMIDEFTIRIEKA